MRLHILVVVVGHDLRREIRYSQPYLQVRSPFAAVIEHELHSIVKVQNVGAVAVDDILNAQKKLLYELRTGRVLRMGFAVKHLRIHALPPLPLAVGRGQDAIVRNPRERPGLIALVANRKKLVPNTMRSSVIAHSESQAMGTRDLGPGAHD